MNWDANYAIHCTISQPRCYARLIRLPAEVIFLLYNQGNEYVPWCSAVPHVRSCVCMAASLYNVSKVTPLHSFWCTLRFKSTFLFIPTYSSAVWRWDSELRRSLSVQYPKMEIWIWVSVVIVQLLTSPPESAVVGRHK